MRERERTYARVRKKQAVFTLTESGVKINGGYLDVGTRRKDGLLKDVTGS